MTGARLAGRAFAFLATLLAVGCNDDGGGSTVGDGAVEAGRADASGGRGSDSPDAHLMEDARVADGGGTPPMMVDGGGAPDVEPVDGSTVDASTADAAQSDAGTGAHFEGEVSASGGTVELGDLATVTVSEDAFDASQTLSATQLEGSSFAELFDLMSAIFSPTERAVDGVRIESSALPGAPLDLTLPIPESMTELDGLQVFVRVFEGNEEDVHDRFVPVATSRSGESLVAALEPAYFRASEAGDGVLADVTVAATDPGSAALYAPSRPAACPAGVDTLGPPLATVSVRRNFNPGTVTTIGGTTVVGHPGTDLVAPDGEPVLAPGCGKVVQAKEADVSQGTAANGGAGGTVVIQMPGIGRVQYMHLKAGTIAVTKGQLVRLGDVIGEADSTGYSTGSHLHMEFRPFNTGQRIEPMDCIDVGKVEAEYEGSLSLAEVQPALTQNVNAPDVRLVLDGCDDTTKRYRMEGTVTASNPTIGGAACTLHTNTAEFGQTVPNSAVIGALIVKPEIELYGVDVGVSWVTNADCIFGDQSVQVTTGVTVPFTTLPACTIPTDPILREQIVSQPIETLDAFEGSYAFRLGTPDPNGCVTTVTGEWSFAKVSD